MNLSVHQTGILFSVGMFAGFIDTVAGGGGMITVPALLSTGLPPALALGTDKLQSAVSEIAASVKLAFSGKYNASLLLKLAMFTILGSTFGVSLMQNLPAEKVKEILPLILFAVFIYLVFFEKKRQAVNTSSDEHDFCLSSQPLSILKMAILGLSLGFYNGFIGPATGTFWVLALTSIAGWSFKIATIYTKPLNFVGNLVAIIGFSIGGNINYHAAGLMSIGSFIGGVIGANFLMKSGTKLIKLLYIFAVSASLILMIYSIYVK